MRYACGCLCYERVCRRALCLVGLDAASTVRVVIFLHDDAAFLFFGLFLLFNG